MLALVKFFTNPTVAIVLAIAAGLWAFSEWTVARNDRKHAAAAAAAQEAHRVNVAEYVVGGAERDRKSREALAKVERELDETKAQLDARRGKNVSPQIVAAVGVLPVGVIVQHNADAAGDPALADRYAGSEAKPSGVGIDRFSGVVGRNYAAARKQDARFEALEKRIIAECEAWNKKWQQNNYCGGDQGKSEAASGRVETKGR